MRGVQGKYDFNAGDIAMETSSRFVSSNNVDFRGKSTIYIDFLTGTNTSFAFLFYKNADFSSSLQISGYTKFKITNIPNGTYKTVTYSTPITQQVVTRIGFGYGSEQHCNMPYTGYG